MYCVVRRSEKKQNNQTVATDFLLTAGHCFPKKSAVARAPKPEFFKGEDRKIGTVTRQALTLNEPFETDAEAIRLENGILPPLEIYRPGSPRGVEGPGRVRKGEMVCFSGKSSGQVKCREVQALALAKFNQPKFRHGAHVWIKVGMRALPGDSGSPAWSAKSKVPSG